MTNLLRDLDLDHLNMQQQLVCVPQQKETAYPVWVEITYSLYQAYTYTWHNFDKLQRLFPYTKNSPGHPGVGDCTQGKQCYEGILWQALLHRVGHCDLFILSWNRCQSYAVVESNSPVSIATLIKPLRHLNTCRAEHVKSVIFVAVSNSKQVKLSRLAQNSDPRI